MNKNIAIFGHDSNNNLFNNQNNHISDTKYELGACIYHTTMISAMSSPLSYDENLIFNSNSELLDSDSNIIKNDLEKKFMDNLKNNDYDYLILDNYYEVKYGVIKLNSESTYVSNSNFLHQTDLFNQITDKKIITIQNDFIDYVKLWIVSCDKFFEHIEKYCPNLQVILKTTPHFKSDNKNFIYNQCYQSILDEYILNNYDVDVLIYDDCSNGFNFYSDDLNRIILNNELVDSKTNKKIRCLKRKYAASQLNEEIGINNRDTILGIVDKLNNEDLNNDFKVNILNSNIIKYWEDVLSNGLNRYYKLLNKFMTARLDIKNLGNENNNIDILEISNPNSSVQKPDWFKNNRGTGIIIEDDAGYLHFKLKCVNDGKLVIDLKSIDIINKHGDNIPVYIDYTSLNINGKEYIHENLLSCAGQSFTISKNVEDSEIVDINVKWMPLNSSRILTSSLSEENKTLYYDEGTFINHDDIWMLGNSSLTRTSDYTELKRESPYNPLTRINVPPEDIIIEFNLYQSGSNVNNFYMQFNQDNYLNGTSLGDINGDLDSWTPIQITIKQNETFIVKNMEKGTTKIIDMNHYDHSNLIQFCFWNADDDMVLRFKNFKIYQI